MGKILSYFMLNLKEALKLVQGACNDCLHGRTSNLHLIHSPMQQAGAHPLASSDEGFCNGTHQLN